MTEKIFDIETIEHLLSEAADELILCNINHRIDAYFLLYRNGYWYDCVLSIDEDTNKDSCDVSNWDKEKDEEEKKISKEILAMYGGKYYNFIYAAYDKAGVNDYCIDD